jgi:hypothetical protein
MATFRRHSLPTQPKSLEETRAWAITWSTSKRHHRQLTQRLGTVSGKTIYNWGSKITVKCQTSVSDNQFLYAPWFFIVHWKQIFSLASLLMFNSVIYVA